MNIREALASAAAQLQAVSATPRLDAELLMAEALGVSRDALLLGRLNDPAPPAFDPLVRRRLADEPIAYIIGRRAFWTIELRVGPGVLVPRADSETLIEAAVDRFGAAGPARILDLGTGPGTLLLAVLDQWPEATGLGTDASADALVYARGNAERLGLADRAEFAAGDWGEGLSERFDLILCNPPYVEADAALPADVAGWEPASALYAGADGLDEYRRLAPQLGRLLAPAGIVCLEIGVGQESAVREIFGSAGFTMESRSDLNGIARCLIATADPQ